MNDDTIRMAREAGVELIFDPTEPGGRVFAECWLDELERLIALARADEREACAKVCDEVDKESQSQWPKRLATMIRARGNT